VRPGAVRWPAWAARLCAFLLLTRASCDAVLETWRDQGGGMGPGALLNGLLLLAACRYALLRPRPLGTVVLPAWAPFLLASLGSVAVAPDAGGAARLLLVQASYGAAFALPFWLVRSHAERLHWLRLLLWSSVPPACWAMVELLLTGGQSRLQASFSHPNVFAFYLLLMVALLLYLQQAAPQRLRWLYLMVLLALLVLTRTRSAWAGCLLLFALYGLLAKRRFLLYPMLAPVLLLFSEDVRLRVADIAAGAYDQEGQLNSYAWRLLLWRAGLRWMDGLHWLYGYGLEAFRYYSPRFFPLPGQDSWDPHNVYIQLYFETGVLGLAGYGWLFLRLLPRLYRAAPDWPSAVLALAMVLAYLLSSWSDNMLYYLSFNWYFWFFMGCAAAREG
jgi:O-antigen ligase